MITVAVATPTSPLILVSEQEYLHTSYHPDVDYIEGFLLERNLGQHDHARLQMLVAAFLFQHEQPWQTHTLVECRLKVRPRSYRIPDIMVLSKDAPRTPVIEQAPLLCIEIISPGDKPHDLAARASEYLELGVPVIWILDPAKRAYILDHHGTRQSSEPALKHGLIELPITELFAQL